MTPTETLPLLVIVVLLLSVGGASVERMEVVYEGDATFESDHALVVAGGDVTVPANATVDAPVYVIGGDARIEGQVEAATVLAGNLTVADGATVAGTLRTVSGQATVADGATVARRATAATTRVDDSLLGGVAGLLLQVIGLGLAGAFVARRRPDLLANVGSSVTAHPLVSGVVGALAGTTLLVLFVYMAFTLLLLPVSVVGLLGQGLVVLYAYVVYGHLLGRRLPVEREDLTTAAGVAGFVVAVEVLGRVPLVGALVHFGLVVVGFGAVLLTYFGLRRFEPVAPDPG